MLYFLRKLEGYLLSILVLLVFLAHPSNKKKKSQLFQQHILNPVFYLVIKYL